MNHGVKTRPMNRPENFSKNKSYSELYLHWRPLVTWSGRQSWNYGAVSPLNWTLAVGLCSRKDGVISYESGKALMPVATRQTFRELRLGSRVLVIWSYCKPGPSREFEH
jgi:hypothetical protein